jgi:hypothetical protein
LARRIAYGVPRKENTVSRTFRLDELETAHQLLRENAIAGRAALVLD